MALRGALPLALTTPRSRHACVMRNFTVPTIALALLIGGSGARAQDDTVIRERCGEPLRIEAVRELRIGGPDDPGRIAENIRYARDSKGRLILWPYGGPEVNVFDSTGGYIASFGRQGGGPGEYTNRIQAVRVGPGDSIHVFDAGNMRHTILDEDFRVAEMKRLPARPSIDGAVRLANGQWVLNAHVPSPERIGWPLHVLNGDGEIERSFGALQPVYRADLAAAGHRYMTPAPGDRVWAAWRTQYRVELWDTRNRRLRSLVRDVPWFRPWPRNPTFGPEQPLNPYISDIHLDAEGVLWVVVTRPVENWRDFVVEFAPGQYTIEEPVYRLFQNKLVEAVDMERACVLARLEAEMFLLRAVADGVYPAYYEGPYAIPYFDLWRLRFIESPDMEP